MLMDYHLHTTFSLDGEQTLEELCRTAEARGVTHMAVTDHVDGMMGDDLFDITDRAAYRAAIDRAREEHPGLVIHRSMELGYSPEFRDTIFRRIEEVEPDYLLGSLHMVNGVDPYMPRYFEGRTRDEAYRPYVETIEEALDFLLPIVDTIAHLDYVSKFSPHSRLRYEEYPDIFDRILTKIIDAGKALELNTSGYRRRPEGLPGDDILTRYRQLGGEKIALGSDAHRVGDVTTHYRKAAASLRKAGFDRVCLYAGGGNWEFVSLDDLALPED